MVKGCTTQRIVLCARRVKQKELDEEREKLECLQRELRNKLLALEEEGHTQREAMMADFDEVRGKRSSVFIAI